MLALLFASTQSEKTAQSKTTSIVIVIIYLVLVALAVFLALKDMGQMHSTSAKVWLMLLAVGFPDLFVILHGLSTSSHGLSFFAADPISPLSPMTPMSMSPMPLDVPNMPKAMPAPMTPPSSTGTTAMLDKLAAQLNATPSSSP